MTTDTERIGKILGVQPEGNREKREIRELLTDSRSLGEAEGTLFFAIPTATGDGARFMKSLYDRGVRMFVTSKLPEEMKEAKDATIFVVKNPIEALQKIAGEHTDFRGEMVAITGSRGKTTLKEWIFQLMEPLAEIVRSPRSYNSQIGVPLSLWEIQPDTEIALIEAGVSKKGEMEKLEACIKPDTVILTNVGSAHAEGFASMEEKAQEKALLGKGAKTIICNVKYAGLFSGGPSGRTDGDGANRGLHPRLCVRTPLAGCSEDARILTWGIDREDADIDIQVKDKDDQGFTIEYTARQADAPWRVPTFREHGASADAPWRVPTIHVNLPYTEANVENAANALTYMLHRGVDAGMIAERFGQLHKIGTRLNVSEGVNGCSIVFDSYTSDFSSLKPALDFLRRRAMPGQTPVLIMSDLRHESQAPGDTYSAIAKAVAEAGISRFIGVGKSLTKHAAAFPEGSLFFQTTEELLRKLSPSDFADMIILLKGAPEYAFGDILEMLEAKTHETVLEVNLDALIRNYNYFRSHVPATTGMVAMVKASGYGAGSYEIAKTLQDCGAAYLAVAVLDEGIDLRKQGITMPIMVMNPKVVNYRAMFANSLEPEIYSFSMLEDVIREAEKCGVENYPIHIKLDTGMHRMGFDEDELPALMDRLNSQKQVRVRSTFSHLATADCPDMNDYTEYQLENFRRCSDYMISRYEYPILRHVLNTAGILRYPEHHYDMVRLGIGLYGVNTLPEEMERPLSVVSTLRTVVISVKERKAGETIGYGRRGVLTRDSRIATIPIGYADGMNRHFGRGAISVRINGQDAPTVGNICMDACMIDVTGIPCREGDAVEIFGRHAPIYRLAEALDTIPYEVLTSVSPRVKRVYYRE